MRSTSRRAVQCRVASRMSPFVAKCQVVEERATSASAATRRWVTAATPPRATTRAVAATIASRTRREDSARGPASRGTGLRDYRYIRTCQRSTSVLGSRAAMSELPTSRRSFLGVAGGAALLCTIGGKQVDVASPGGLEKADAVAAGVRRPRARAADSVPQLQPAPGGTRREYWVQAETTRWAITPTRRDDWHNRSLPG